MREIILNFPKQFKKGVVAAKNTKTSGEFDNVVVCGMGGSSWPAEILRDWLDFTFPFYVNKTYHLPPQVNKKSLVIIISYSGNTEESLTCYQEAKKRNLKIVGLSTDGELKKLCQKDKTPLALIPNDVPAPRLGCGYTFAALCKILNNAGLIEDRAGEIVSMAKKLNPLSRERDSQCLAEKINNNIPVIYASEQLKTLSYIWKIKFNETAKMPAFCNYFPELNHNELSAYSQKNNFFVIILRNKKESLRILKRMSLTADIIRAKNMPVEILDLQGTSTLEKIFNSILFADLVSYHLALKRKVNPLLIKLQEDLKKKLKSK
jgi:glucose/mannose-6-phosphate isomerase